MWLISPLFKPIMGMDSSTIHYMMPMKERKKGILFDGKVTNTVMDNDYKEYDLSKLEVPVLIMHSKNDKLSSYKKVGKWKNRIRDCTYVIFESGGHLMTGNGEKINQSLQEFINKTK